MMTGLLVLGISILLLALLFAWTSGKEESFGWGVGAFFLASVGVIFMGAWMSSLGKVSSELDFNQTNKEGAEVYIFVGDTISMLGGEKTHITTLFVPGDREYVYRFKNLPPKGYKSLKTEAGQTLYVPEKYILSK